MEKKRRKQMKEEKKKWTHFLKWSVSSERLVFKCLKPPRVSDTLLAQLLFYQIPFLLTFSSFNLTGK